MQIAEILQAFNHSTSSGTLDVSGLALDAANTAYLIGYILSGGQVLPNNASATAMLATAQGSATFSGGGTVATPVTSTYQATVATNLQNTISGLPSSLNVPLSSLLPGRLAFFQTIRNGAVIYGIKYRETSGSFGSKSTGSVLCPGPAGNYTKTYTIPATGAGNVVIDTYTSANTTLCPNYTDTLTVTYDDEYSTLGSAVRKGGALPADGESYSFTSTTLDTSFGRASVAGKTITVPNRGVGGVCSDPKSQPFQLIFDATGANYTMSCKGTGTTVLSGAVDADSGLSPGLLALTNPSPNSVYIGQVKGASGKFAVLQPGNQGFGTLVSGSVQ